MFTLILWPTYIWYVSYPQNFTIKYSLRVALKYACLLLSKFSPLTVSDMHTNTTVNKFLSREVIIRIAQATTRSAKTFKKAISGWQMCHVCCPQKSLWRVGAAPLGRQWEGLVGNVWEWSGEDESASGDGGWEADSITTSTDLWASGKPANTGASVSKNSRRYRASDW